MGTEGDCRIKCWDQEIILELIRHSVRYECNQYRVNLEDHKNRALVMNGERNRLIGVYFRCWLKKG